MLIALRFVEQQKEKPMPHTKKYGSGFSCKDFSKQNKNRNKRSKLAAQRGGHLRPDIPRLNKTKQNKTRHLRRCNKQANKTKQKQKGSRAVIFKSRPAVSILENVQEACNDDDKTTGDDKTSGDVDPLVVKTIQDNLTNILFCF